MNILQISSTYPVKDAPFDNPYVRNYILEYKSANTGDQLSVLKPLTRLPEFLIQFRRNKTEWRNRNIIATKKNYVEGGIKIFIAPYFSIGALITLHAFFSWLAFFNGKKVNKSLTIKDIEVCHSHCLFPDGLIAYYLKKKYNIPYVITIRRELRIFKNPLTSYWAKKIITNASFATTQNSHMYNILVDIGMKNIKLLSTGINSYFFNKTIPVKRNSNDGKIRLITVCNLLPVKNVESVINALALLEVNDNVSYDIYGTGPLEKHLKQLTSDLKLDNIVSFKGVVKNEDLPQLFPKYNLYIQPSFMETLGLSYFEALSCGLPVVLTKSTGAWPLIKDFNVAFIVDPVDPISIKDCLLSIINDRTVLEEKSKKCTEAAKIASLTNYSNYFQNVFNEINSRGKAINI